MISSLIFFFNDTATTHIYTLSLHDALPILLDVGGEARDPYPVADREISKDATAGDAPRRDRKSTRLNSSHTVISYAVFCLKKKKQIITTYQDQQELHAHAHVAHSSTCEQNQ